MRREDLFNDRPLAALLAERGKKATDRVDTIDADVLLSTPTADLVAALLDDAHVEPLVLHVDQMVQLPTEETKIDVSQDHRYAVFDRSRPALASAARIAVAIPFDGDATLFSLTPSQWFSVPSRGRVAQNELVLTYESTDPDAAAAKRAFDDELRYITQSIAASGADVRTFLGDLEGKLATRIDARKERLLRDRGLEGSLGVPVRRRKTDRPAPVPVVRKRVGLRGVPTTTKQPYRDEYVLADEHYEEVLAVIAGMGSMLERSPSTFAKLDEEEIRDHILLQLNGTFEGQAGGELFNGAGKTDIVVRIADRNVFIAECKFWRGESKFVDAVDQLLGYLVWRDTKAAIVLFIKQRDASAIVQKAAEALARHPNFKGAGTPSTDSMTRTNVVLHQQDDPAREITVALMPLVIRTPAG